MVLKIDDGEFP